MITKIIRSLGIFIIILFSAASIFLSMNQRELLVASGNKIDNSFLSYASFFEERFYDLRMKITLDNKKIDNRIVLAKIDDKSIKKLGRFPWSRATWAKFIDKMASFNAKVVAFDVFFSEPERGCNTNPDADMAKAIVNFQNITDPSGEAISTGNQIVLPYTMHTYGAEDYEELPASLYNYILDTQQQENLIEDKVSKSVFPIPILEETEAALGHIQATEDSDGVFRHYRLVANVETLYFPSFGLLTYQIYSTDKSKLKILSGQEAKLELTKGNLSINYSGETKVRWLGGIGNFPTVSISDIIYAKDGDPKMKKLLEHNIVFVGSTAFGAHDLRHTPVDASLPGVYFHMNIVHMLLDGLFFQDQNDSTKISWLLLLLGTALIIIIQLYGNAILDLFFVSAITIGIFYIDTYFLLPKGYEIKLFFCLFSVVACYSWTTFLNFYLANKDKSFLKNAFGNYISPELIDDMYKTGEPPKLGGDSGIRTAYFTDIQSFSSFSKKLSGRKLVGLLNEYLTVMTDILLGEGGTLDKYEGDAIIAFFGAPMPLEDHAARACRVAVKMQNALDKLREKWTSEGDRWPAIVQNMRMRIGINSGEIVTGNMGSANRMNYTMMGDSVNLAARLEEAAKQYGMFTQITHITKDLIGDEFELRELDTMKVMGKEEPVTTFDILGIKGDTEQYLLDLKKTFSQGLSLYKEQKWDQAIEHFEQSVENENRRYPEQTGKKTNPSLLYIERCKEFKQNPPPENWDGVFTLTKK